MKKILITGGAGFIGSHTSVLMINEGHDIVILDNFSNSDVKVYDRIKAITGKMPQKAVIDICNKEQLDQFWSKNRDIDSVIHFCSQQSCWRVG